MVRNISCTVIPQRIEVTIKPIDRPVLDLFLLALTYDTYHTIATTDKIRKIHIKIADHV